jgi:4-hydroxy-4-methyl-2-oxoglutarate aldolase
MSLTPDQLLALQQLSTCVVADAIETFDMRLRNEGFADGSIRCCFEDLPPIVGYAATARIRTAKPPMVGPGYKERIEWWTSVHRSTPPHIVVLEDVDSPPGLGALIGGVGASILRALGAIGVITNGAVRDLPRLREAGFQCLAGSVVPSHAFAHVFEYNVPVRVGGLRIAPGDLLHADRHGVVQIPIEIARDIPAVAETLHARNAALVALCRSPRFSVERLREQLDKGPGGPFSAG